MDNINNVSVKPLNESRYIEIYRMKYSQNDQCKTWDIAKAHDSVAILIHNTERDVFVFVKQFRPPVYLSHACQQQNLSLSKQGIDDIDSTKTQGSFGLTHELCAGIIDKTLDTVEIARMEVLEEVGYDVPVEKFEKIITSRGSVGVSGSMMTQYYVQVQDNMKVSKGGGCPEEGEWIDVVEVPVKDSLKFAFDESIEKPIAMVFAILWFHQFKSENV